jgi:hypothetical protein
VNTGQPVVSIMWWILCFPFPSPMMDGNEANADRTVGTMEQRAGGEHLERRALAAVFALDSGFRVF